MSSLFVGFGLETAEEVGTPRRAFAIGAGAGILGFGAYLGFRTARS